MSRSTHSDAARHGFAEIHPPLTGDEARIEASRCLFCYDAPCTRACPTHIDVPRFIRQIMHRDEIGAARTILDANIFGGSCARACPTQVLCEGACVDNTLLAAPVQIGRLQRFACDTAHEASHDFYAAAPDTGRRVAVVGAGPAGLTCAHELRKRGHAVDVFDAAEVPGGLNTLGIAAYKITTQFALTEVRRIERLGVKIHLRQRVDGARMARLLSDYDAVFLGVGLGRTAPLTIPGENLEGVWEALEFIFQTHTKPLDKCKVGRQVIVIGGGNTAIDAANAAVRLGAEHVALVYRRDRASMPAFQHEIELAAASGVKFVFNAAPVRIVGRNGKAVGVRFVRTKMRGRGRGAKITPVRGSEFTLAADMVIRALGQAPLRDLLERVSVGEDSSRSTGDTGWKPVPQRLQPVPQRLQPALQRLGLDQKGRIAVDPATLATSVPRLFAGGDCRSGAGEEIVNAVQDGKTAAAGIDAMLAR